jgi:hypothetical protein
MYKLTQQSDSVTRSSDNACIPFAEGNSDYAAYQAWLAAGNAPVPYTPTQAELDAASQHLQDQTDLDDVKGLPFITFLVNHRPAQIATRITADLASDGVEAVITRIAKALSVLAKSTLR